MPSRKRSTGFTLIEVMIVVAILGIIMAIALPNYRAYVLKGNRSEGMAILNEIMQAQERYAAANGTYVTDLTTLGYADPQPYPAANSLYEVSADTCASGSTIAVCVNLTAAAQGGQVNDNNGNSGNLSLNSRGTKVGW